MFVKICGFTRAEDARAAVELGASAVGFVFWPNSRRRISAADARSIARELPPYVIPVGVFVNQPAAEVNDIAETVGLGAVQLHGDERPDVIDLLARPVIKAVSSAGAVTTERWPDRVLLLVDAHDPERRGGTGTRADWGWASELSISRRILLAGGLDATNVRAAALQVSPFGVDVSSGVERAPGIKDHVRMQQLFEAIRAIEEDKHSEARPAARRVR